MGNRSVFSSSSQDICWAWYQLMWNSKVPQVCMLVGWDSDLWVPRQWMRFPQLHDHPAVLFHYFRLRVKGDYVGIPQFDSQGTLDVGPDSLGNNSTSPLHSCITSLSSSFLSAKLQSCILKEPWVVSSTSVLLLLATSTTFVGVFTSLPIRTLCSWRPRPTAIPFPGHYYRPSAGLIQANELAEVYGLLSGKKNFHLSN